MGGRQGPRPGGHVHGALAPVLRQHDTHTRCLGGRRGAGRPGRLTSASKGRSCTSTEAVQTQPREQLNFKYSFEKPKATAGAGRVSDSGGADKLARGAGPRHRPEAGPGCVWASGFGGCLPPRFLADAEGIQHLKCPQTTWFMPLTSLPTAPGSSGLGCTAASPRQGPWAVAAGSWGRKRVLRGCSGRSLGNAAAVPSGLTRAPVPPLRAAFRCNEPFHTRLTVRGVLGPAGDSPNLDAPHAPVTCDSSPGTRSPRCAEGSGVMGKRTSIMGHEEFRSPCTSKCGALTYSPLHNDANSPVMRDLT